MKNFISGAGRIRGTVGDDVIHGGAGRDVIFGDYGSDTIVGGAGSDILYGGQVSTYIAPHSAWGDGFPPTGNPYPLYYSDNAPDIFVFHAGDAGRGAERDHIRGFEPGVDKIDLSSMGPNTHFIIQDINGKALIKIDADHNGSYEMHIDIVAAFGFDYHSISASDFILA